MEYLLAGAAILLLIAACWPWKLRRWLGLLLRSGLLFACLITALTGGYLFWLHHRPLPPAEDRVLFEGVTYHREVRTRPRLMIIHVVTVDLDAPGIDFLVTPSEKVDGGQLRARTTSDFVAKNKVQVAINGSFFEPWHSNGPLDYYPHDGDPVNVFGLAASRGEVYSEIRSGYNVLNISKERRVRFGTPAPVFAPIYNALSGREVFLRDGRPQPDYSKLSHANEPHPRTVVALDASGRKLLLIVIDGRQANYSEGATLPEVAEIVREFGGVTALHLDGGGSSTLVVEGENGRPKVLNSPVQFEVPGLERPVANHLGVYAKPAD